MEVRKLKTLDDLLLCQDERAELNVPTRESGPGGWWIATEVSVACER